jgi:hypothetical protein
LYPSHVTFYIGFALEMLETLHPGDARRLFFGFEWVPPYHILGM